MSELNGRICDFIITPDKRYITPMFFPHLFKDIRGIKEYQIIQESEKEIILNVVKNERYRKKEIDDIIWQIRSQRKGFYTEREVKVFYHINTHSRRQDRSNIIATIDDCLEKARVIKNDRQIKETSSVVDYDKKCEEITKIIIEIL